MLRLGLRGSRSFLFNAAKLPSSSSSTSVFLSKRNSVTLTAKKETIFSRFPDTKNKKTLYDKDMEKDNCGVGLVAHMKKQASRQIVLDANEMLVRMSHRGGCGCEVNTGDGAGWFFLEAMR